MPNQATIHTKWFKDKLAEREMSQRGLARQMGLDSSAVSLMLRGKREMRITEAAEIARLLGVPAAEVLAHAGISQASKGAHVPIAAILDGHGEISFQEGLGSIPNPAENLPSSTSAIQCRTAGSDLEFMDRWMLFVDQPRNQGVMPDAMNRMSLVRLKNGTTHVGNIKRGYQDGRWTVSGPIGVMPEVEVDYAVPILLIKT